MYFKLSPVFGKFSFCCLVGTLAPLCQMNATKMSAVNLFGYDK